MAIYGPKKAPQDVYCARCDQLICAGKKYWEVSAFPGEAFCSQRCARLADA